MKFMVLNNLQSYSQYQRIVGNRHSHLVRLRDPSRYPGGSRLVGMLVFHARVVCPVRTYDHTALWSTGLQVEMTDEDRVVGKGMYVHSYY